MTEKTKNTNYTNNTNKMQCMTLCAVLTGLSMVLSMIKIIPMPFGGSITLFSMLACTLTGYFCGVKWGIASGVSLGILNLAFGGIFYHPVQVLLDYVLGFGVLGLAGITRNQRRGLQRGYGLACVLRFLCSTLSGIIFFASYAPEGMGPILYSVCYNLFYIGGEGLLTLAVLSVPSVRKAIERLGNGFL